MGKRKLYKILKQYIEKNSIYKLQPIQNYYYSEDHIDCRLYDRDNFDGISVTYIKRENISNNGLEDDVPEFKNIHLEDCVCVGADIGVRVRGMAWTRPTIHDISIVNCNFQAQKENEFVNCENIKVE